MSIENDSDTLNLQFAQQCGVVLPVCRQGSVIPGSEEKEKQGDKSRLARMLPGMSEEAHRDVRESAGRAPARAILRPSKKRSEPPELLNAKIAPRPSSAPEAKAAKKPRK